jgi:hypothetical protein
MSFNLLDVCFRKQDIGLNMLYKAEMMDSLSNGPKLPFAQLSLSDTNSLQKRERKL